MSDSLKSKAIQQARDQLDDAFWFSLDEVIKRWAKDNGLTLNPKKIEEGVEKLTEGVRW